MSPHEQLAPRQRAGARPVVVGVCILGALAAVLGLVMLGGPAFVMIVLVLVFVLVGLVRSAPGWRKYESYPDLGERRQQWERAGATSAQLSALNEAHRLSLVTPQVGYRDRRTVVNPLADAYAIFSSPAWKDPWLADHRLQIDPIAEAAEIIDYLHRVTQLHRDVRRQKAASTPQSAVYRQYGAYEDALQQSLDAALRRSRALTHYRYEVVRLERLLDEQREWPNVAALGDRVLDLLSESARHDLATGYLDDNVVQLARVEIDLREITSILEGSPPDIELVPRGLAREG